MARSGRIEVEVAVLPSFALTDDEHAVIDQAGHLWDSISKIVGHGPTRDDDLGEFLIWIHLIQQKIMAQAAARAFPSRYRLLGEVIPKEASDG